MLRLVRNEFRMNASLLCLVFMLMNLGLIVRATSVPFPVRYSALRIGFAYAMAMPLIVLLREAYYKGHVLARSMPLSAFNYVLARYSSLVLLGLVTIAYGWLYQVSLESTVPHLSRAYLAHQMEPGYAVEHSLIARGLGFSILLAVAAPLAIRFGTFWRIIIGYFAVQIVWGRFIDFLLAFSLKSMFFLGMSRWVFFASLIAVASLSISISVSVWLYGRREF